MASYLGYYRLVGTLNMPKLKVLSVNNANLFHDVVVLDLGFFELVRIVQTAQRFLEPF